MGSVDHTFWLYPQESMMQRLRTLATSVLISAALLAVVSPRVSACTGNCDSTCSVTVDQIISMVNITVGAVPISACRAGDTNGDGAITIEEITAAVGDAINDVVCRCSPRCGDEQVTGTEECDDGGTCIGGPNAGTHCTREGNCLGNGVCTDGAKIGTSCAADSDCPGAACQRCRPFGGDGCAANCTTEVEIWTSLVPGIVEGPGIKMGTTGAVVHGDVLTIPLGIAGARRIWLGHPRSDDPSVRIPYVRASFYSYHPPPVSTLAGFARRFSQNRDLAWKGTLACSCVREVVLKTCGGTLFDADGAATASCTAGFLGEQDCLALRLPPCTPVHGPGNTATGFVVCGESGLDDVDLQVAQDAGGNSGMTGRMKIAFGGHGPMGSGLVLDSSAIGLHVGACPYAYCRDTDPISERGIPTTSFSTTGMANAVLTNVNGQDGVDIVNPNAGEPYFAQGSPANCSALQASPPSLSGYATAGAYTLLGFPTFGDIVVTDTFVTQ